MIGLSVDPRLIGLSGSVRVRFRSFMFHENIQDDAELLVNAKLLPELSDGSYVEIWKYNKHARDPPHEQRVVLQVRRRCCLLSFAMKQYS